jgi:hypothetical protein
MSADWSYLWGSSGNRSSTEDPKTDPGSGEDEVVEPDQGNGMCFSSSSNRIDSCRAFSDESVFRNSPYPHYFPAPTGGRPQPGCFAHLYSRTPIYAGADHKVCIEYRWCQERPVNPVL